MVRTPPFHGGDFGSNPCGATNFKKINMLKKILERYQDEELLIADGFDDAIIGIEESSMRLIYSVDKCINILMDQGMEMTEAVEYFEFNVSGSYVGEQTPIWCEDFF
jgi:hypothetical protein